MTKDVLVTVKGLETGYDNEDSMEIVCSGTYYFRNGKHYIKYEEIMEETMRLNIKYIENKRCIRQAKGGG